MKMKACFFFVCLVVAVAASGLIHAQNAAARPAGRWSGRATGTDAKPYSVTVILDESGAGLIEYPSLKCGGTLRFVRRSGAAFVYQEKITHGQTKCGQGGRIDVLPDGAQIGWTRSISGTKATATLTSDEDLAEDSCASCEVNYDQALQACFRIANPDDQQKCHDRAEDDLNTCERICRQ
jgi:hypothetical protein